MNLERVLVEKGTKKVIGFCDVDVKRAIFKPGDDSHMCIELEKGGIFSAYFPVTAAIPSFEVKDCRKIRLYLENNHLLGVQLFDGKNQSAFESAYDPKYEFKDKIQPK